MNYQDIYKADLNGAYLFYGDEQLLMDRALSYIVNRYTSENFRNFNVQYIDGKNLEVDFLIAAIETLPIFDLKKIVIVKNFIESLKNTQDKILEMIKDMSESTILIFLDYENEILKTTKFYKYFSKNKTNIEFSKLGENDFRKFLNEYIQEKSLKITPANVSYLAQKSGYNSRNLNILLYDVKNELDKLAISCKQEITKEKIDEVYISSIDTNIFNFLEALSNRNISKTLFELENLNKIGEPIQKVFYMISRQFRLMMSYKTLEEQNFSDIKILDILGIKQYELSKIKISSNKFSKEKLKEIYNLLLEYDYSIKTKTVDERSLFETLLVEIIK